jgi:hypothetical protein
MAVIVQDRTAVADGKEIVIYSTPDTQQIIGSPAGHGAPGVAVIVQDGAVISNGKNIIIRATPGGIQTITLRKWVLPFPFLGKPFPKE